MPQFQAVELRLAAFRNERSGLRRGRVAGLSADKRAKTVSALRASLLGQTTRAHAFFAPASLLNRWPMAIK
jgi:hypothetical protein